MSRFANRSRSKARRSSAPAGPPDRPGPGGWRAALLALALSAALIIPASAQAATPPQVASTSVAGVAETSATLQGKIDSGAKKTEYRFEYITLAAYEADGESFGEGTVPVPSPEGTIPARPKATGDLKAGNNLVTNLNIIEGALDVGQAVNGLGIAPETRIASLGEGELTLSKPAEEAKAGVELTFTGPQPVAASATGLVPGTAYRVRISAHHGAEAPVHGQTVAFAALASAPVFGPCSNDLFRSGGGGVLLPPGEPSASLPDCRAYEQVSPTEKDGADAVGEPDALAAAPDGQAITFLSAFGMPGGEGSQTFPSFLAARSASGWSSAGLLPPASAGNSGYLLGRTPDSAYSITEARRIGAGGYEKALFLREGTSGPPRQIVGYQPPNPANGPGYSYAGASADDRLIFFESSLALPPTEGAEALPGTIEGSSNVYVYDTGTGELSLAAQMNSAPKTEALLPHGAVAGPYDWGNGSDSLALNHGGANSAAYLQDGRAVSAAGDLFFTASGTGQLYERVNPTTPQSAVITNGQGEEECSEPDKACTYHVSATHKTNSPETEDGSDPAGPQPAAFMAASEEGSTAYFTSPEKLTDDANTGPEVSPAQIGRAKPGEEEAEEVDESFLPAHALGMATSPDGHYLYWANPAGHSIGRADLTAPDPAATAEPEFLVPEETEAENYPEKEPGVLHSAPTAPRYVALGPCAEGDECLYWTNTGPLGSPDKKPEGEEPVEGAGTIGRAELDASGNLMPEGVDAEFIAGKVDNGSGGLQGAAFNPQGIAVSASHIYWANAPVHDRAKGAIARATLAGEEVEPQFWGVPAMRPNGLTIGGGRLYYGGYNDESNFAAIERIDLEGGEERSLSLGESSAVRGVAVDAGHVYWANPDEPSIGRAGLGNFVPGLCETTIPGCEKKFIELGDTPTGLATDPTGEHIYWSTNGESPANPGNDLYRFQLPGAGSCEEARGCLTDLTAEAGGNGAEALGVLGSSADGSYLYFVANGVLAANEGVNGTLATAGNCRGKVPHDKLLELKGECNLYLYHAGELRFIARLEVPPGEWGKGADKYNWVPQPNLANNLFDFSKPRKAQVSADGRVLSFLSSAPLSGYDSSDVCQLDGVLSPQAPCPEYYRFDAISGKIACLTCNPTGAPPSASPTLLNYATPASSRPSGSPEAASVLARNLTDEGNRFFFQSTEALVGSDVDGIGGCPRVTLGQFSFPACQDVYEWEAPGTGSCSEASSSYSAQDEGCIYLLSPGNDARPALFADADESGENAFFFTRDQLVGQDEDQLFDLYDARTEGGLASQNEPPPAEACSGEACKPGATAPPATSSPTTPNFRGEGNVKQPQRPKCPKGRRLVRSKGHARCVEKHRSQRRRHHRHSKEARR